MLDNWLEKHNNQYNNWPSNSSTEASINTPFILTVNDLFILHQAGWADSVVPNNVKFSQ